MSTMRNHDRRGHGLRGPLLPPETPRWRSRREAFDQAVLNAYAPIEQRWRDHLTHLDIAVDTVPRMHVRPGTVLPDEIAADGAVPLGRLIPAGVDEMGRPTRPRIVIFRRPIELRAGGGAELEELLSRVLVQLVGVHLNLTPEVVDSRWHDWTE
ncbi:metallopeptidase family protein [Corynebacterium sp. TAE3-ERU12]|uniref:metallopeptidase family protein n=1 Tax=Corynebacterium sp. TAE3-ERU12 TaxID=2849491 RepID=UPI001C46CBAE|nr:metallopeptidase family protein [Corynebacterium sp. TAE3-ERU12]MBV7294808.1 metallopeptidase family protein [Corynebacterium sp. TAE3-ERU12]